MKWQGLEKVFVMSGFFFIHFIITGLNLPLVIRGLRKHQGSTVLTMSGANKTEPIRATVTILDNKDFYTSCKNVVESIHFEQRPSTGAAY